ncbi:type III polyketide synthase [Kineococcus esterisolvens]|uniref:type III polyketide synthase n=1 Tax=unclassified Kineococcus TaxID=2621656 RepID=UPI003D7CE1BE
MPPTAPPHVPRSSRVVAVEPVLPPHRYGQAEIAEQLAPLLAPEGPRRQLLHRLHAASGVQHRHLALPLERYARLGSFTAANAEFAEIGLDLAERALKGALATAGVTPEEVDFLLFTTVTGVGAPSLDAALAVRCGLRPTVKRLPSFGLGCAAGAAGLARVDDYLAGHPGQVGVLVSVELCSLTLQREDGSTANLVASGLFGDGASAVVLAGADRAAGTPGWDVLGSRSRLYPGTADALGWDVGSSGLSIVLAADLPDLLAAELGAEVRALLGEHGLDPDGVRRWVVHAGGPKVLRAVAGALDLADGPTGALAPSWDALRGAGNLSSSSVLHVLAATPHQPGEHALVLAVGPGVGTEQVLLRAAA